MPAVHSTYLPELESHWIDYSGLDNLFTRKYSPCYSNRLQLITVSEILITLSRNTSALMLLCSTSIDVVSMSMIKIEIWTNTSMELCSLVHLCMKRGQLLYVNKIRRGDLLS